MSLLPLPETNMSIRFRRQIKLFEKLMSQVLYGREKQYSFDFGEFDDDIPTFFFGEGNTMSRSIQDDTHFEGLNDSV